MKSLDFNLGPVYFSLYIYRTEWSIGVNADLDFENKALGVLVSPIIPFTFGLLIDIQR